MTFDGLTVDLKLFQHDNKDWIALTAPGSGKAAPEAKKIADRASHWIYAIPSYKAKMMQTKLADLLEPPRVPEKRQGVGMADQTVASEPAPASPCIGICLI